MEWCETCQEYDDSSFSRNNLPYGAAQMLAGFTSAMSEKKSILSPLSYKKRICFDMGWHVCSCQVVRPSESTGLRAQTETEIGPLKGQQRCKPLALLILRESIWEFSSLL
jgi:hypothetical protein